MAIQKLVLFVDDENAEDYEDAYTSAISNLEYDGFVLVKVGECDHLDDYDQPVVHENSCLICGKEV
jgi:hypothetical protein